MLSYNVLFHKQISLLPIDTDEESPWRTSLGGKAGRYLSAPETVTGLASKIQHPTVYIQYPYAFEVGLYLPCLMA